MFYFLAHLSAFTARMASERFKVVILASASTIRASINRMSHQH